MKAVIIGCLIQVVSFALATILIISCSDDIGTIVKDENTMKKLDDMSISEMYDRLIEQERIIKEKDEKDKKKDEVIGQLKHEIKELEENCGIKEDK